MSFNLRSIKTVQTFDYDVRDDAGNPTGVVFTLAGPNHPVRRASQMASNRKLIRRANKTGRVELPDPEEAEAQRLEDLAAFTLGWRGYVDDDGQDVPYSPQTATALYADPDMTWLANQVETALGEKDRFTQRVATN